MQPALCSDAVFVRRAYLDLTGMLPTAEEAKTFIEDAAPNKRIALVDRLLDESAHCDYWAMKWSDILRVKAEFPVKVWPNAAQAYHRWLWESVAQNKPYDQFAREMLTSSGSNFRVGPVNFYRAIQDKTPEGIAAAVGLAFMGSRVPFWPEQKQKEMAVFFSQVGYKPTSEWKEEIVFWDPLHSTARPALHRARNRRGCQIGGGDEPDPTGFGNSAGRKRSFGGRVARRNQSDDTGRSRSTRGVCRLADSAGESLVCQGDCESYLGLGHGAWNH